MKTLQRMFWYAVGGLIVYEFANAVKDPEFWVMMGGSVGLRGIWELWAWWRRRARGSRRQEGAK